MVASIALAAFLGETVPVDSRYRFPPIAQWAGAAFVFVVGVYLRVTLRYSVGELVAGLVFVEMLIPAIVAVSIGSLCQFWWGYVTLFFWVSGYVVIPFLVAVMIGVLRDADN